MVVACSIVAGSQSDFINYCMCLIYAQMIFRAYEIANIPFPNKLQIFNIFSISSMVMFVQLLLIVTANEKQDLSWFYEH